MRIGAEFSQVTPGTSGGIVQAVGGVLAAANRLYPEHEFVLFETPRNRGLFDASPPNVRSVVVEPRRFWPAIDEAFDGNRIDVLFRSFPGEAPLRLPLARQIVWVPDLQHEAFPEFFRPDHLRVRRAAFNLALARAGAIGTLTEWGRRIILAHEWTACPDVFLMPPALPAAFRDAPRTPLAPRDRARVPAGDYFVCPANLWPHKNHGRVLEAFRLFLRRTGRSTSFVLTGDRSGWPALRRAFADLPVIHLGYVSEGLLRALLERARALVFCSLYEGFGIPLLEAFEVGTPVVSSRTTGLAELAGDATLACDPSSVEAISAALERIVADEGLRAELAKRGTLRARAYTWEASARSFVEACGRVAGASQPDSPGRVEVRAPLRVSIVTPSFNQGRFLRATIDSVLTQSYPHIQYLVVDGGSTDESRAVLASYGADLAWLSEPDEGQADAINKGLARATGDVLAYLNSDDVLLPGAVARVVRHFQEHAECDLVYGRARYIDVAGRATGEYRTAEYSFRRLMRDCCICQPAAFWRSRVARLVGLFDETLEYAMDYDYWLRIDRAGGRIQHIPDELAGSRQHPESKTLVHREAIYAEILRVCLRHGGYVDPNYFRGLWHHRVSERGRGWPAGLRRVPAAARSLAWLHHKWFHRRVPVDVIASAARRALAASRRAISRG